jgi:type I restriction enzyme M protein
MVSKRTAPAAKKAPAKTAPVKAVAAKKAAARKMVTEKVTAKTVAVKAVKAAPTLKTAAKKAIVRAAFNENRNERGTDQFVRDLLRDIGQTRPYEQDGGPKWKKSALAGGSKSGAGTGEGKPEFVFVADGFIVVVEDKKETRFTRHIKNGEVVVTYPHREAYAFNGAVHYAATMLRNGVPHDKGIFAVGIGGDERHHEIAVAYLGPGQVKLLADLDNLNVFAEDAIAEYHSVAVLGNKPKAEVRIDMVKEAATRLHEGMRNYGSVENHRKAPLVSAILLALEKPGFDITSLTGKSDPNFPNDWDGVKIYQAAEDYMRSKGFGPQQKIGTLLDQFSFIKTSPPLNQKNSELGMSPLRHYAKILKADVQSVVNNPAMLSFDVLGNFYHEFISYGGGDGSTLGIVLTPEHITTLMAELIDVGASDWVLDPAAGTASFLIAAMHRMFIDADNDETVKDDIRKNRLHGIELQDKLFAIGTTNMILRGDGKANFRRNSIFDDLEHEMRGDTPVGNGKWRSGHGFTKVLLNPPYGQAKDNSTRHLSELAFIERALEFLNPGGRLAAIVPQSTMVGKTAEDRARKVSIMKKHTLDTVITLNVATFVDSGVSVHPVIAIFTAFRPHKATAKVRFVDFKNDGYKALIHRGLTDDGTAASRRKHLIDVLKGDAIDKTSFIVRAEANAQDEWQHSYFYFNDVEPELKDFEKTVADYLAWQVDMHAHGKGHLIAPSDVKAADLAALFDGATDIDESDDAYGKVEG